MCAPVRHNLYSEMWAGLSQLLMVKVLLCKKITVLGQFLGELYDLKVSHGFAGSVTCHGL